MILLRGFLPMGLGVVELDLILVALIDAREGKRLNVSLRPWESVE